MEIVQPAEPLYLADDAEAVLDLLRERALLCPGCGLPRDETMDREAEQRYRSRAVQCHACAARDRAMKKFTSGPHDSGGLYWLTERR